MSAEGWPLVELLNGVFDDHRRGESQRDCIEGLGWVWACWCSCDWHGPDRDHDAHLADATARVVEAWLGEQREAVAEALDAPVRQDRRADAALAALRAGIRVDG